jgi:hypothetical protein
MQRIVTSTRKVLVKTRVSGYVRSKLREALPEDTASEAIDILAASQIPLVITGSVLEERIHLAIVKLVCDPRDSIQAEPDAPSKLASALELAKIDWRDLLVSAGLEHENWREVLIAAGYRAPPLQ